jgi:hypothetical protein
MNTLRIAGALALATALAACNSHGTISQSGKDALDTTGAILSIFAPTPEEQCKSSGGTWQNVTTYDAAGTPTYSGQCVTR